MLQRQDAAERQLGTHGKQQDEEVQDPFAASLLFPVYAESGMTDCRPPFTDCTNQGSSLHQQARQSKARGARRKPQRHSSDRPGLVADATSDFSFCTPVKTSGHLPATQAYSEGPDAEADEAAARVRAYSEGPDAEADTLAVQVAARAVDASRWSASCTAAGLTSMTEEQFWEAARADLTDTADPVRHRSRLQSCQVGGHTPTETPACPSVRSSPELCSASADAHCRGITPLLGMQSLTTLL